MSEAKAALNNLYPGLGDQIAGEKPRIALTVFALDPGTKTAGVSVVQFAPDGCPVQAWGKCVDATHIKGSDERAKFDRIAFMRREIGDWLHVGLNLFPIALDVRAYEPPFSQFELAQLVGACLSLGDLNGLPVQKVTRSRACAAAGCYALCMETVKGETRAESDRKKREKQVRLKEAVMAWAAKQFAGTNAACLAQNSEHVADALAVAQAVFALWQKEEAARQAKAAQTILLGPGLRSHTCEQGKKRSGATTRAMENRK